MPRTAHRLAVLALVATGLAAAPTARAAPAGTMHYPDIRTIIPTDSFSVVTGASGRDLRYTHLVYNAGPGPLEIQPQYSPTSGNYLGQQQLFTHDASNRWSLVQERRVADAFVFHAEHGHFHFPLAAFGLYRVAADGGVGAPVAISPKNGFCISDSYIYDSSVAHAGAFVGSQGTCADPTTLRGLSVGGADEYDYRDPGQAIPLDGVADGTYWFRAISDPNNDFVEADESNNETDVKVTVAAGRVTAGAVTHPDTTPPPVTLDSPAPNAGVSGTVTLSAGTPALGATVQFLVDGTVVGQALPGLNTFSWDSTTVPDGSHLIAARATDAQGRTNTSEVNAVTVSNAGPPPSSGALAIDAAVSKDGRGAQTTPPLSTPGAGDTLVAFVAADGPASATQTATVTGGLVWTLVRRANTSFGTSEIWTARASGRVSNLQVTATPASAGYDVSLHVVAFAGAAGVGAGAAASGSGAPSASLKPTRDGSWVFGVGNDWDRPVARTLGAGQTVQHQWIDTAVGDTFWVQSQPGPTARAGTPVTIADTAPTNDRWNLAAVEVLPASSVPPTPDTTAPQVSLSDLTDNTKLTGITRLAADVADNVGVTKVQFLLEGRPLQAPATGPPFSISWDTRTVPDGTCHLSAQAFDAAGNVGTSATVPVVVDNSGPPPATITIDTSASVHARGTLRATGLTTAGAGEQLVAFVALDGPAAAGAQQATVAGAGLNDWTLVKRSNTQAGVSEIWTTRPTVKLTNATVTATPSRAGFDGLLHVIAFKNAAGVGVAGASGLPIGAPDLYVPGIPAGSWVFAVGNDWDRAVARTPAAGQVVQHQWVDSAVGDTFWVQSTAAPTQALSLVTIHDDAPTNDRWNLAAVEVTASPSG